MLLTAKKRKIVAALGGGVVSVPLGYVGGQAAGEGNTVSVTVVNFALTGGSAAVPATGDLVIVCAVAGTAATGTPAMGITTPVGYTALGQINQSSNLGFNVSYKRMGAVPDTSVTIPALATFLDAKAYTIQVFRGVHVTTPLDVAVVSATGTATGRPTPGPITPVTTGAWIVICGGSATSSAINLTAPAGYTNFRAANGADTAAALVGSGFKVWSSGTETPATYGGGSVAGTDSWAAYTIALRPS